jgi:hypothetical protein
MKTNTIIKGAIVTVIIIVITFFLIVMPGCEKEPLGNYQCTGQMIRSCPVCISDTTNYTVTKENVTLDFILEFQDNRNYTLFQIQNGLPVTTISTMVCHDATCINIK